MSRTCEMCGKPFETKRPDAKTCSSTCRVRRSRSGGVVPNLSVVKPMPERPAHAGSLLGAVMIALEEAKALDTPGGRLAVSLATRLDDPNSTDTGSAVASLSRELRAVLAETVARTGRASSPLDLIREGLRVV